MASNNNENISLENITPCPECNLISILDLYYKNGKSSIDYFCENNHKGSLSLEEYIQKYKNFSLTKEKCSECNKNQNELNDIYSFCSKCNKFLCHSCAINHSNNTQHDYTNIRRYDALCKLHSNYFCFFCNTCKKNLCMFCRNEHNSHDIIDLINFKNSFNLKQLEEKIKSVEKKLADLELIKNRVIKEVDKIKNSSELEIKYFNILLNTFKYEEMQNNMNYNIIQNMKNFDEAFNILDKINIDKINKKFEKFFSSLESLNFQKYIKTINLYPGGGIFCLCLLKDGRMLACRGCGTINVLKKDTYELLSTNFLHRYMVHYCTQLNNGNIITCSNDSTMKIIKISDDNRVITLQTLTDHSQHVCKAIEIKNNIIISISSDKTMKIWTLNSNNNYFCKHNINTRSSFSNILKLNENEFVTHSRYSLNNKCLQFWNSNNYSNISTINDIESNDKSLCKLNDDILFVGGTNSKGCYLIKISKHQIVKYIEDPNNVNFIFKLFNNYFVSSITKNKINSLVMYKYDKQNLYKKKVKEKAICYYSFFALNEEMFALGECDVIEIWRY